MFIQTIEAFQRKTKLNIQINPLLPRIFKFQFEYDPQPFPLARLLIEVLKKITPF